jgi:hypothetical protein
MTGFQPRRARVKGRPSFCEQKEAKKLHFMGVWGTALRTHPRLAGVFRFFFAKQNLLLPHWPVMPASRVTAGSTAA